MIILPFFFAGFFMLTLLNPHYTATLITQAIPRARLLGTVLSPIIGFLSRPPVELDDPQRLASGYLPMSQRFHNLSEFIRHGPEHGLYGASSRSRLCNVGYASFKALSDRETCSSGLSALPSSAPYRVLEALLMLIVVALVWYACLSLICSNARVPQPLSAVASVEDFLPQVRYLD